MINEKLKPCPFCGKDVDYDEDKDVITCLNTDGGCGFYYNVEGTLKETIERWNRRATAGMLESLLGQTEAEALLGEKMEDKTTLSLKKIRSFMNLPLEERRRILAEQAKQALIEEMRR